MHIDRKVALEVQELSSISLAVGPQHEPHNGLIRNLLKLL